MVQVAPRRHAAQVSTRQKGPSKNTFFAPPTDAAAPRRSFRNQK